jgi:hypothetical protein
MDPASLYSMTLSQLDATELTMTSPAGNALIQNASPTDHSNAVKMLIAVHEARLTLGNANLQSIVKQLQANEAALTAGIKAVQAAIRKLDDLTKVLSGVNTLLTVVGKIVPMMSGI